jgi:phosphate starvation-inducible PhoH-like protein
MFMFLTRIGEHSKCIVTGDPSQIDLRPKSRSGLLEATELLEGIEGVAFVRFESKDVVRHPVVARIIEAYDRGRSEKEG